MRHVWVLGAGGMLGGALTRKLYIDFVRIYRYREVFDWTNPKTVVAQFEVAVSEFLARLGKEDTWEIYWAAGSGSMSSSSKELVNEITVFKSFLRALEARSAEIVSPGVFGFASSAGAIYTGGSDFEVTERTQVKLGNDYAAAKLEKESLLKTLASQQSFIQVIVARFSTLYGPGQSMTKRQGLLSHIARCVLRNRPVEIFVPLDTLRDYLYVDDAASDFIGLSQTLREYGERMHTCIVASERSVSISEIIATFNRLNSRRLRVICNRNSLSERYPLRVSFRSVSPMLLRKNVNRYTLPQGIGALLLAERLAYIAGH